MGNTQITKDMKHFITPVALLLLLLAACGTTKTATQAVKAPMSAEERHLVDSILQSGLDNEALFTLMGNIKPMSSLPAFGFPVANTDSAKRFSGGALSRATHGVYLDRMCLIQQAVNKIDLPDLRFIVVPYLSQQKETRIIQVSVVRVSLLDSLLNAKEHFFGQFGLVPGTDPVVVATAIEGNGDFERWRGYGYLFGYPDYAVDFFNEASFRQKQTGEFVTRNFFRIPTYRSVDGNFVYAYPKNHTPTAETDSVLYNRSVPVLEKYKSIRNNYLNPDSTVQAYRLLQDYYKKQVAGSIK
jgi:hypothetical protein